MKNLGFINQLYFSYNRMQQWDKTEKLLRETIEIKKKDDPQNTLINNQMGLALLFENQNRFDETESVLKDATERLELLISRSASMIIHYFGHLKAYKN